VTLRPLLAAAAVLLAACPGDDPPRNPPRLWLSLVNGDETRVQLVPIEPNPF
jgi:uncharacterized Zn-finger protein